MLPEYRARITFFGESFLKCRGLNGISAEIPHIKHARHALEDSQVIHCLDLKSEIFVFHFSLSTKGICFTESLLNQTLRLNHLGSHDRAKVFFVERIKCVSFPARDAVAVNRIAGSAG